VLRRLLRGRRRSSYVPRIAPLLPRALYGDLDEAARSRVDAHLRSRQHTIPTEPGVYLDREGDRWTLDEQGCWTDHLGERRDERYTPLVSAFGPFTTAENAHGQG